MNNWLNFFIVVAIQLLVFLVLAYKKRPVINFNKSFILSILALVLFGIFFDLIIGKYLGVFDYGLGFGLKFLFINSLLSYGPLMATLSLLRVEKFFAFYIWTIYIGIIYESANYLFPVWSWTFAKNIVYKEIIIIFGGYFGLALLLSIVLMLTTTSRFEYINFMYKLK